MEPGLMRHRVTVQEKTGRDEFGEAVNWEDVVSIRASIQPLSGREFIAASKEYSEVTHKVTIRYHAAVRPSMRLLYGSRILEILHIIDPWEKHQAMTLMCKELTS